MASGRRPSTFVKPLHLSKRGEEPNPIDIYVGARLKIARIQAGASQEALAAAVGVTFQQMQKYERGANRISASRLFNIAQALAIDGEYFFSGLTANQSPVPEGYDAALLAQMKSREALELVRTYSRIRSQEIRRRVCGLLASMSR